MAATAGTGLLRLEKTLAIACASSASQRLVLRPWAQMWPTSSGLMPALARACFRTFVNAHRYCPTPWASLTAEEPKPTAEQVRFFETKVRPVLANHCQRCHGPEKQSNGLRLDSAAAVRRGSDVGPVLVPGKPDESLLIKAVRHTDDMLKMPPKERLKPDEVAALTEWVKMGAPWPESAPPQARVRRTAPP